MLQLVDNTNERPLDARIRWRIAADWRHQLAADELRLTDWIRTGRARIVKHGQHRTVYRVDLPQGRFYLKQYHARSLGHTLVDRLRGSSSEREWRKSLQLSERGIPTVRPVALGQLAGGSLFMSEELTGATPLGEFLLDELPHSPAAEQARLRIQLCAALARFIAQAHDAGVTHDDLHPGNLMLHRDAHSDGLALSFIDLPGVSVGRRLGWRASRENLVMLRSSFEGLATPDEFASFWRQYRALRSDLFPRDDAAVLADLARRVEHYQRRLVRSREKRFFQTNRDYHRHQVARFRAYAVSEVEPAALARLAANPDQPLIAHLHQPVKLTRGTQMVEAHVPVGASRVALAYKRYRSRNIWKLVLDQFRGSRARRAWKSGHALLARGISTPRPMVCVEPHRRPSAASYLGTAWIENAQNLHELAWELARQEPAARAARVARYAESLGTLIGRLHFWRYSHRDLKGCNLLLVDRGAQVESYLVDLDSVQPRFRLSRDLAAKNLARLATSLSTYPWITRAQRWRFLRAYVRAARLPAEDIRWFWQRTERYTGRNVRRMRGQGKPVW